MKKSAFVFTLLSLGIAIFACEQQETLDAVSQLETAKLSFKKDEPAEFTFKTNAPADQVKWSVSPNQNVQITPNGYTAKIHFGEAGRYYVTATDQKITSRTAVNVDTTTYIPSDTSTVPPPKPPVVQPPIPPTDTTTKVDTVGTHDVIVSLQDEEFTLTPFLLDSLSGQGLSIRIESKKSYPCQSTYLHFLGFYQEGGKGPFKLAFNHVVQPGAKFCNGASGTLLTGTHLYPIPQGKTGIEITLNGTLFSGYVMREGNTFTITWPYTSGVKFSKLTVSK